MDDDRILLFPQDNPEGTPGQARSGGMELRDYFASHCPSIVIQAVSHTMAAETLADWAYIYADAMMKRRRREPVE